MYASYSDIKINCVPYHSIEGTKQWLFTKSKFYVYLGSYINQATQRANKPGKFLSKILPVKDLQAKYTFRTKILKVQAGPFI